MNFLDILIFVPVAYGAWQGFKKGFIIEIFTLLALLVGIYAGIHFSDLMSEILREKVGISSKYLPSVSFTITFLLVGAMVFFGGKALEKVVNLVALKPINKFAGMGFGMFKFLFFVSVFLVILESYDQKGDFISDEVKDESLLYTPLTKLSLNTMPPLRYSDLFMEISGSSSSNTPDTTSSSNDTLLHSD